MERNDVRRAWEGDMKLLRLVVPILAGLVLAGGTLVAFARSAPAPASPPGPRASETDLLPAGSAEDIHIDSTGKVWVTENDAGAARQLDPATGAYTLYTGLTGARDAQIGPDGNLWWTTDEAATVGRMSLARRTVTTWTIALPFGALNLAFDAGQRVWLLGGGSPGVYQFDPNSGVLCSFALPGAGGGLFIAAHNGALWFADDVNVGVGRITPTTNAYTFWPLNFGLSTNLEGLTFAPNGDVWLADHDTPAIVRLQPDANRATAFGLPGLDSPVQLAYHAGQIWFAQEVTDTIGFIDPAAAGGDTPQVVTPTTSTLAPICLGGSGALTTTAGISSGVASFSPLALTSTVHTGGTLYRLPAGSLTYGLAFNNFDLWLPDNGRDKLVRLDTALRLYLPLVHR